MLNARQKDGATLRQHLEMAQKSGRACPELMQPDVPRETWYLWRWFCEISQGRQRSEILNPLSWAEIKAWAEMTNRNPNPWEVATIRAIDWEYLI